MKLLAPTYSSQRSRASCLAFTLAEVTVAMAVFMLILAGVLTAHLFGVRLFEVTKSKLGASDEARRAVSLLISEIRSAKAVKIGNGNISSFTEIGPNTLQRGSAIQIYSSTNTNSVVRYFWDVSDKKLKRTVDNSASLSIVANSISNSMVFTSEDYSGNTLTNNENNRVIGLTLQFYQIQYPVVQIGQGYYFDYYQLRTKITRRTLE